MPHFYHVIGTHDRVELVHDCLTSSQLDRTSMLGCHPAYQCADGGYTCGVATPLELQNKLHYYLLHFLWYRRS